MRRAFLQRIAVSIGCSLVVAVVCCTDASAQVARQPAAKQQRVIVVGPGTEYDRITAEVVAIAQQRKTLLLWLIDGTQAGAQVRGGLGKNLAAVQRELRIVGGAGPDARLLTAVASFGAKATLLTPKPLADASGISDLVGRISVDRSGKANVFGAVAMLANKFRIYRQRGGREIVVVIVTNQSGTDQTGLEQALQIAKRSGVRCYVVGHESPFGRAYETINVAGADAKPERRLTGPETPMPERLRLPDWKTRSTPRSPVPSGFGPYALSRLCIETSGQYLMARIGNLRSVDDGVMQQYWPDLSSLRDYTQAVRKNRVAGPLSQIIVDSTSKPFGDPPLHFSTTDAGKLRSAILDAKKMAAKIDVRLSMATKHVESMAALRPALTDKRWQANYDLARAQLLAHRVRSIGYQMALSDTKTGPSSAGATGIWNLALSGDANGAVAEKLAAAAKAALEQVRTGHARTPWALVAARELQMGFGWKWVPVEEKAAATTGS